MHQPIRAAGPVRRLRAGIIPVLLLLGGLLPALSAQAGPALTLDPADGALWGNSGQTVGWGFELFNDENYLVVTSAVFPALLSVGTFIDYISAQFLVVGPAPESETVSQAFDPVGMTGLGAFEIDQFAPRGALAAGLLTLTYDLFSRSPNDLGFDPETDTISVGNLLTAQVSVGVPAPAPVLLVLAGLVPLVRRRRPAARRVD